jgi:hypothetical protein
VTLPGEAPVEIAVRLDGTDAVPLSAGRTLHGACAILLPDTAPLVAHGRVLDAAGNVLAKED